MHLIHVAAATLNQTPLDWEGNKRNILAALDEARRQGVSILCLPELCITGYGCEDAFLSPGTRRLALEVLDEIRPQTRGLAVCVGLPLWHNKAIYNVCALLADGELHGFVAKRALAGDGIHYEPRWFKPWPRGKRVLVRIGGSEVPMGDVHFDCGGVRVGFEICEDAWIAQRPGADLALEAVDVILNPSASHFAFGKRDIRRRLVLEGSRAFGVTYVYANLVGNEAGRAIYDGDALIATGGEIVASGERFRYEPWQLVSAVVDVDLTRTRHAWLSSYRPHVSTRAHQSAWVPLSYPAIEPRKEVCRPEPWEVSEFVKEEEFARAIALGLFDYLRKTHALGFVVSLSGGADSSAVACLVWLMVRFALRDLTLDGLRARLPQVAGLEDAGDATAVVGRLLTTAYQSTRNSSATTREAARSVAQAIGARHVELDVDALVEQYSALVSDAIGRPLDWRRDDLALQNIQARTRAPGVWFLANVLGALLLSTSNRSEAAVGYATMDGDTAGGISPIAGIDKAFLQRWLRWLQTRGPEGIGAIPALAAVTLQPPTAELRPAAAGQTDEADLMPYDVLDAIERAAIRDKRMPAEVFRLMRCDFPGYEPRQLATWVERFFRLWSRNQWKRERYAPSFHVDDANLDPKTWCRFPILSGGFERELAELWRLVQ
ncbi:MAG TPA: NAD(+) synthase [Polyangiaceae bacterium]|nr:NAD(+) synthase [Polyangiaceae bacterium]